MNDIRKLIEEIEKINEVSDFDGPFLDGLVSDFIQACEQMHLHRNPVQRRDLAKVLLARVEDHYAKHPPVPETDRD